MDFTFSDRVISLREQMLGFMDEHVYQNESVYNEQLAAAENPHDQPPIMLELQAKARAAGLWNLFIDHDGYGAGLSNLEYAPLAEIAGRSVIANEVFNCSAPDTGNMELLAMFGTPEQKERWLEPLLDARIRSAFAMTEPDVASSDPRNLTTTITRDGDQYVVNGRKWWTSGTADPNCKVILVVGVSDPDTDPYRRQSIVLVPPDTPGVSVVRNLPVFGRYDRLGHGEVAFEDVRVPAVNMLGGVGDGFAMAQARLGPGRMHYAMRAIGFAERALDLMCDRVVGRTAFGGSLSENPVVMEWIARSRIEIDQARLLVLHAAWLMDTHGNKAARLEVAAIKVAAVDVAHTVVSRAIQAHGGAGVSDDTVLAHLFTITRALQIADGPTEVHLRSVARRELKRHAEKAPA